MLAALMALALAASAADHRDEAWALAYTGHVERSCPGWARRTEVIPIEVLPTATTWNGPWGDDGVLMRAWRLGKQAATAAHKADPDFCAHPTRSQPDRAPLLNRILVRNARAG